MSQIFSVNHAFFVEEYPVKIKDDSNEGFKHKGFHERPMIFYLKVLGGIEIKNNCLSFRFSHIYDEVEKDIYSAKLYTKNGIVYEGDAVGSDLDLTNHLILTHFVVPNPESKLQLFFGQWQVGEYAHEILIRCKKEN